MPYNLTTMQSIYHGQDEIVEITYNGSSVYQKSSGPDYTEPFYVENISNTTETLTISQAGSGSKPQITIYKSKDRVNWDSLGTTGSTALTLPLQPKEKIYLSATANGWSSGGSGRNQITGVSKVGGNIMSLLYGRSNFNRTSFPSNSTYNFNYIFRENANLISASKLLLPAASLTQGCYQGMFTNCTSLNTIPTLPALNLATDCYRGMFEHCSSLTTAPDLPATTLANTCYRGMFVNCSSLTNPPSLPATTLATGCYQIMFRYCTSLETAPDLEASTLVTDCYKGMFDGCTSLNSVKCLAENNLDSSGPLYIWLQDVSSTGTFTKKSGITWPEGVSGIPDNWTVTEV